MNREEIQESWPVGASRRKQKAEGLQLFGKITGTIQPQEAEALSLVDGSGLTPRGIVQN